VSETRRPFVERGLRPTGGVAIGAGWLEAGREVLRARGRSKEAGLGVEMESAGLLKGEGLAFLWEVGGYA
jgi:hypothetical protein